MKYIRAAIRLLAIGYGIGQLLVLAAFLQTIFRILQIKRSRLIMAKLLQHHSRFILFACAVKYKTIKVNTDFSFHPALILSNHINYFDVLILAALHPMGFLAKTEVGQWGLLGSLISKMSVIFVKREDTSSRVKAIGELARELEIFPYMVFPQGTTVNHRSLDDSPWYPGQLFALKKAHAKSQSKPRLILMALSYDGLDQMAWIDEMSLISHLWHVLQKERSQACVVMSEYYLEAADFNDLRALSYRAKNIVEEQFVLAQSECKSADKSRKASAVCTGTKIRDMLLFKLRGL